MNLDGTESDHVGNRCLARNGERRRVDSEGAPTVLKELPPVPSQNGKWRIGRPK
jgi:hypothetical protein